MKFILDAGHALTGAVGAQANGYKEEVEARKIVSAVEQKLKSLGHKVVIASCDHEANANKQLQRIVAVANNHKDADLFISVHFNAFEDPKANGVEVYSYSKKGKGHEFAVDIQDELVKLGFTDRKKKEAGFYVLRHTICPAVLIETAFLTNADDMKKLNVDKVSSAIVKAVTGTEIAYKDDVPKQQMFRVVAGTYTNRQNAEIMQKKLKEKGFDSFLTIV